MITSKLSQLSAQQLPTETLHTIKGGGVFCEVYIGYMEANDIAPNEAHMAWAISLDEIVSTENYKSALASGGTSFMNFFG